MHDKDNEDWTMLHWAAVRGHCDVTRYVIEELKLDPQDRDKVCLCRHQVCGKACMTCRGQKICNFRLDVILASEYEF